MEWISPIRRQELRQRMEFWGRTMRSETVTVSWREVLALLTMLEDLERRYDRLIVAVEQLYDDPNDDEAWQRLDMAIEDDGPSPA